MTVEVRVPVLPESVADGTLVNWHKMPGDPVKRDENLVDLETDKVVLEIPAPADGVLGEVLRGDGEIVTTGDLIATIEGKLTQIKNKMPKAVYDEYTVVVGDYLWKISGKDNIYGDPTHWMRIYSYNLDQIKDPDLIYPDWVLKIQREVGADEYLVAKGDYLRKIAENPQVLGDLSSWTKIYEKNKGVIGDDPNLIFPYTVLVIPTE